MTSQRMPEHRHSLIQTWQTLVLVLVAKYMQKEGRAITQVVRRWLPTAVGRVRA
jgi:hypothetical protein